MATNVTTEKQEVTITSKQTITLINGAKLQCHPRRMGKADSVIDNDLILDTTEKYFNINKKTAPCEKLYDKQEEHERPIREFFLKHAFFFFENANKIISDSRMFLAPIPFHSELAYSGTSGFQKPTLGIYIEWWRYCSIDITKDSDGNNALTYIIKGSPLSGNNSCACVYPDGSTKSIEHHQFIKVWSDLARLNRRYDEAKLLYDSYSLQEVYKILKASEQSETSMLYAKISVIESINTRLKKEITDQEDKNDKLQKRFTEVCLKLHQAELETFAKEYYRREKEITKVAAYIMQQKKRLKEQMKEGQLDHKSYQKIICPLTQQHKTMLNDIQKYISEQIESLTSNDYLTKAMIEDYIKKGNYIPVGSNCI